MRYVENNNPMKSPCQPKPSRSPRPANERNAGARHASGKQGSLFRITALLLLLSACRPSHYQSDATPPSHQLFDTLLQRYVDTTGLVDYTALQADTFSLKAYLQVLENHPPDEKRWSKQEQMAYWINAYNAYTLLLICRHYPLKSIKDISPGFSFINSSWDIRFIRIGQHIYDLNEIEHNILRKKFEDPRIHAAINCASMSCPKLARQAYRAEQLDQQLNASMHSFLVDTLRNKIRPERLQLSSIFSWFASDFKQAGLRNFIKKHTGISIKEDARITYLPYHWQLNDRR